MTTTDQKNENEQKKEISKKDDVDPRHNRTADIIYEKVDSYMHNVRKTTCDMIPKAITLYVIKEVKNYINDTLIMKFIGLPNDEYVSILARSPFFLNQIPSILIHLISYLFFSSYTYSH